MLPISRSLLVVEQISDDSRLGRFPAYPKAKEHRRSQTTARGQPPAALGLRQARSNGSRQAWGATS
jgi:hypothetical protein